MTQVLNEDENVAAPSVIDDIEGFAGSVGQDLPKAELRTISPIRQIVREHYSREDEVLLGPSVYADKIVAIANASGLSDVKKATVRIYICEMRREKGYSSSLGVPRRKKLSQFQAQEAEVDQYSAFHRRISVLSDIIVEKEEKISELRREGEMKGSSILRLEEENRNLRGLLNSIQLGIRQATGIKGEDD